MFVLLSVLTRNAPGVYKSSRTLRPLKGTPDERPTLLIAPQPVPAFSGYLALLDWGAGEVRRVFPFSGMPSGFVVEKGGECLRVCESRQLAGSTVHTYDRGKLVSQWSHRMFNNVHTLHRTSRDTYLLTCSGTDTVLEVDTQGREVWRWVAPLHGYHDTPLGHSIAIDDDKWDYRMYRIPADYQSTHVNSCVEGGDGILCTLYHQGTVITVHHGTKVARTLVEGLHQPHFLRRCGSGWLVSDSRNSRVLLLDDRWGVQGEIHVGSPFVQDAVALPDEEHGYLIVGNDDLHNPQQGVNSVMQTDSNGSVVRTLIVGADSRLFQVEPLAINVADRLLLDWKQHYNPIDITTEWRWE